MIISINRWGIFTEELKKLSNQNTIIYEISGNDEIAVSIIMDKSQTLTNRKKELLYESRIVSKDRLKRSLYLMPVNELLAIIKESKNKKCTLEHVYDY
jgi:hypothetical protein